MSYQWVNGSYKFVLGDKVIGACIVEGKDANTYGKSFGKAKGNVKWEIGDFGEANKAVTDLTGNNNYNIKMQSSEMKEMFGIEDIFGFISEDGKDVTIWLAFGAAKYIWITEQEADEMRKSADPSDCPPSHHKIQPENLGKIIWVSGPPGHGKSTTCKNLMETNGFVYYEGDCFSMNLNPFIPPSKEEPADAGHKQRELKDISEERLRVTSEAMKTIMKMMSTNKQAEDMNHADSTFAQLITLMCQDINQQRRRMGGDWAVGFAVAKKAERDLIRSMLGPDLVFVVLEMDDELILKRLRNRKDFSEETIQGMANLKKRYEPATETEENAIALKLTKDLSPVGVIEKILNNKLLQKK